VTKRHKTNRKFRYNTPGDSMALFRQALFRHRWWGGERGEVKCSGVSLGGVRSGRVGFDGWVGVKLGGMKLGGIKWCRVGLARGAIPTL
jgi:hypothetical protein